MTIIVNVNDLAETEQVTKHLNKQIDVLKVSDITEVPHIERELVLIKVNAPTTSRSEIQAVIDPFRAHIVDVALKQSLCKLLAIRKGRSVHRGFTSIRHQTIGTDGCHWLYKRVSAILNCLK